MDRLFECMIEFRGTDIRCFSCCVAASRLGLYSAGGTALSGEQVDNMDLGQLQHIIHNVSVFYRVSPRHKHKIVRVSCQFG